MAAEAAEELVARLRALPRPPPGLEAPLDPGAALRLLCTPSGPRLALLEWLCCRLNPPLAKRLKELRDGPEEARMRELAVLAEELMLSKAGDRALVEGTAPPEQQLGFIRDLLDAAPPKEEKRGILLQVRRFLKETLETPEGREGLSPPPLTPGPETPPGTPPGTPPCGRGGLEEELGETRGLLQRMEAENPELGGPPGPAPPLLPIGQDLAALASAFVGSGLGVLQTHMWGAAPPKLAPCGPLAPPVCRRLRHLQQGLEATTLLGDLATEGGGDRHHAMESHVAALQKRFKGSLQD